MDRVEPLLELSREVVGDTAVVRARGDVDHASAPELDECARSALQDGARSVVFDLGDVPFMDSSGLRVLIQVRQLAHALGGNVTVRHPSATVIRLLELTGIDVLVMPRHDDGGPDDR